MLQSRNGVNQRTSFANSAIEKVSIFLIITSFCACSHRSNTNVSVVYQVTVSQDMPCEVFIAYKDATGYVTLYVDEDWIMQVDLPHRSVASLLVVSQKDLYTDLNNPESIHPYRERGDLISAQIIHDGNVISDSSDDVVTISVIVSSL